MIRVGLLLAAGRSQRFGTSSKLLALFNGKPLVVHAAGAMLLAPLDHRIAIVGDRDVADLLDGFDVLLEPDGHAPQSSSIALGARRAGELGADRLLIALADMPLVSAGLLRNVLALCSDHEPSAATDGSLVCPPACFPARAFGALGMLKGDRGGFELVRRLPGHKLAQAPVGTLRDVDTKEDLRLLERQGHALSARR